MPLAYQIAAVLLFFSIVCREICHRSTNKGYPRRWVVGWLGTDLGIIGLSIVLVSASFPSREQTFWFYLSVVCGLVLCLLSYSWLLTAREGKFEALDGRVMSGIAVALGVGTTVFLSGIWWSTWFHGAGLKAVTIGLCVTAAPFLLFLIAHATRLYYEWQTTKNKPGLRETINYLRSLLRAKRRGLDLSANILSSSSLNNSETGLSEALESVERLLFTNTLWSFGWLFRFQERILEEVYHQFDVLRAFRSTLTNDGWVQNALPRLMNAAKQGNTDAKLALLVAREYAVDSVQADVKELIAEAAIEDF